MSPIPVRPASLLHSTLGGEVVVYNPDTSEAHTLKGDVGRLWLACDRSVTIEALAFELGLTADEVTEHVTKLIEIRLLDDARGPSRRTFVRGGAVVGGALVSSVLLPEAAAHASSSGRKDDTADGSFLLPANSHAITVTLKGAAGGSSNAIISNPPIR